MRSGEPGAPRATGRECGIRAPRSWEPARVGSAHRKCSVADDAVAAVRLLRHAPQRPFEYEFKILDQTVPNAFALPGGKIYVSRGLLSLASSEDELAGVLGHEITHAVERHAAGRIEHASRLNPFIIGLMRAAEIAEYSRDQERDADRGGQILAAQAGYDPVGIATFWAIQDFFFSDSTRTSDRSGFSS